MGSKLDSTLHMVTSEIFVIIINSYRTHACVWQHTFQILILNRKRPQDLIHDNWIKSLFYVNATWVGRRIYQSWAANPLPSFLRLTKTSKLRGRRWENLVWSSTEASCLFPGWFKCFFSAPQVFVTLSGRMDRRIASANKNIILVWVCTVVTFGLIF
jgi:hypothetical protein